MSETVVIKNLNIKHGENTLVCNTPISIEK